MDAKTVVLFTFFCRDLPFFDPHFALNRVAARWIAICDLYAKMRYAIWSTGQLTRSIRPCSNRA